jgi:hypothetical protein
MMTSRKRPVSLSRQTYRLSERFDSSLDMATVTIAAAGIPRKGAMGS